MLMTNQKHMCVCVILVCVCVNFVQTLSKLTVGCMIVMSPSLTNRLQTNQELHVNSHELNALRVVGLLAKFFFFVFSGTITYIIHRWIL